MENYVILTDTACDLPLEYLEKRGIAIADLTFRFDGEEGEYTVKDLPIGDFYGRMRGGAVAKTAALNAEVLYNVYAEYLKKGQDVLYIVFSSGLSGTFNAARLAAERARAEFPERKIAAVDSLCASGGEGLLVAMVADKRDAGATFDELEAYARETVPKIAHWFTVDDLVYLKRGGRVSPAAAFFGNMLGIKPVLHVDDAGHLIPMAKVRGRRTAVLSLAEKLVETREEGDTPIFITHADCEKDAELLKNAVEEKTGAKVDLISYIGPVIGAHSGPGTLALFFVAKER
jgi:DegV family protein with EDD domain